MKYVAAFMLAALSGEPTKAAVTKIVTAHGGEADSAKIDALFTELEGKSLDELIAAGKAKISSASVSAAPAAGAAAPAAAKKEEAKKEEPKEEEEADLGFSLFD
jgi:large subunit ribosomal protein LP2